MNDAIQDVPVDQIAIPNPRTRNQVVFQTIVSSIRVLGLKKPITVSPKAPAKDGTQFDLVCGQGRLEAYKSLGHLTIPAIVIEVTPEERFLMGLIENVARQGPSHLELLKEITSLKQRGYSAQQMAAKLGMDKSFIQGFVRLLEHGDERLIKQVESGRIPINVAVTIATGTDADVQQALCDAYETGGLRGHKLVMARRVISARLAKDRKLDPVRERKGPKASASGLMREYKRHIGKQQHLIRNAEITSERILLIVTTVKRLLADEEFVTLLRAEQLETMPEVLAERIAG